MPPGKGFSDEHLQVGPESNGKHLVDLDRGMDGTAPEDVGQQQRRGRFRRAYSGRALKENLAEG